MYDKTKLKNLIKDFCKGNQSYSSISDNEIESLIASLIQYIMLLLKASESKQGSSSGIY